MALVLVLLSVLMDYRNTFPGSINEYNIDYIKSDLSSAYKKTISLRNSQRLNRRHFYRNLHIKRTEFTVFNHE